MNKDLFYIFDKNTFIGTELGEVQNGFNMSFVIDGTKDSCKIEVWSFSDTEIEPYTVAYHYTTNTWWIVSNDKIERYMHDDGFLYVHNLELLGAIELLNARDLTDCGFNSNTYTVGEFIDRLFKLSLFEYSYSIRNSTSSFFNKKVDFIKTFENYTLLTALREFLDAYNMCPKLSFISYSDEDGLHISSAELYVVPKTGDVNIGEYSINSFADTRETKTINKESFGNCVVSNAENVVSSTSKTFPSIGGLKPSGTEYVIKAENGVLRLPSKVYKGNWLKIISSQAPIGCSITVGNQSTNLSRTQLNLNFLNENSIDKMFALIKQTTLSTAILGGYADFYDDFVESFDDNREMIMNTIQKLSTVTLYDGNQLNPVDGTIVKGPNVPYLAKVKYYSKNKTTQPLKELVFCDKEMKNTLPESYQGIAWERGSNLITGFDGFEPVTGSRAKLLVSNFIYTDIQVDTTLYNIYTYTSESGGITATITLSSNTIGEEYQLYFDAKPSDNCGSVLWVVNYVPMSDLKLKLNNKNNGLDIQLYNQNGKLTDSVALSKLLNSYSKEITSDTITRFMQYKKFSDVPKVGSIINVGNYKYVINNVSLDFSQNERSNSFFGYYIETEITMSKYVSTKSLMVNPSTNIRDYGIPQNYNVKRKQVYRDYYQLKYAINYQVAKPYMKLTDLNNFGQKYEKKGDLTSIIRLQYDKSINGSTTYYYQLETTKYVLNKMTCIVTDFNDNNIIGYGSQNVWSGFVVSRILSGTTDDLNTPISYTDEDGRVKNINLLMVNQNQLYTVYSNYLADNSGSLYQGDIINYSVFIPSYIYTNSTGLSKNVFSISETNYYKDALEVPVFEYICQLADSEDVLIGDNFFLEHENCIYFYTYVKGDDLDQNNVLDTQEIQDVVNPIGFRLDDGASITVQGIGNGNMIYINLTNYATYVVEDGEIVYSGTRNIESGKDYAIFRHSYNLATQEHISELMFIVKKVPSSMTSNILIWTHATKLR